ncbi:MAG TPA: hypothetical protein VGJ95_15180 [Pseudonocardiaceae bacterium]|jgi:hypothetical protein
MTDNDARSREDQLAAQLFDQTDAELLAELARIYEQIDPVPEGLVERIGFTLTLADLEIELARLINETREPIGARGEERARTVTFSSESLTTMVTITPQDIGQFRIDGWLAPGAALAVELRTDRGSLRTTADLDGRFEFIEVRGGLVQLVIHPTAGSDLQLASPVVTPAMEL